MSDQPMATWEAGPHYTKRMLTSRGSADAQCPLPRRFIAPRIQPWGRQYRIAGCDYVGARSTGHCIGKLLIFAGKIST